MRANLVSISHRCHIFEVASVQELTKEAIKLAVGCLQGGVLSSIGDGIILDPKEVLGRRTLTLLDPPPS